MAKYTKDIAELGELTLNDTAANSYLTILVNTGFLGIASYLTYLILLIRYTIKNLNNNTIPFFIAFICYLIQDCFNLWVVIVTPIFWILMGIMFVSTNSNIYTNEMEEKNEKND